MRNRDSGADCRRPLRAARDSDRLGLEGKVFSRPDEFWRGPAVPVESGVRALTWLSTPLAGSPMPRHGTHRCAKLASGESLELRIVRNGNKA